MWAGELLCFMGGGIKLRMETCVNWGGPIAMVPCLHQGNNYIQSNVRIWKKQKCIPLVGGETPLTCAGRQTTPSHGGRYRSQNGNLGKLGWTYHQGTMFAPRKCSYENKATGMESPEMYSTSRCRNPTYLCGPANYPVSWGVVEGRERKVV